MSVDLLERATRALRSSTRADGAQMEQALERLERARRPSQRERRGFRTLAWTVAAMLVGVGAWANATGRVNWFAPEPPEAAPVPSEARRIAPQSPSPPAPLAVPAEEARALAEPAPAVPVSPAPLPKVPPRSPKAVAAPAAPAPAVPSPVPAASRADTLYREAHALHFGRGDDAAALAAWDRYLDAAEPGHRLSPEARFNRAIALYRLGQAEAARRALLPFAEGEYGGYRKDDARRLLRALAEQVP